MEKNRYLSICMMTLHIDVKCDTNNISTRYRIMIMIAHLVLRLLDIQGSDFVDKIIGT
jgi:hypothetical protein